MTMLTRAEMVTAVENGDAYCRCGYRKSEHDTPSLFAEDAA
jgi:hypothetical protein